MRKGTTVVEEDNHRYNRVLSDSVFSLCPAGAGPNSLRLWESLSVGCVPVLLSDEMVMPDLSELSGGQFHDWGQIVLFHAEAELEALPDRLRALTLEELQIRSDRAIAVMELINNRSCLDQPADRHLPGLRREESPETGRPTIVVPVYGPTDHWYWRSRKHGFYNLVLEWYLRGYINILFGDKGYYWWGKPGEILLMERDLVRDLLDRKVDPPRWEGFVPYRHAFFFNQYHLANSRSHKACYFAFSPEVLEQHRTRQGRLGFSQRMHTSIFAGSVENETQAYFRHAFKNWESVIDIFSCPDKRDKAVTNRFSMQEYLHLVSSSRFGISFRGNGPKCFRELEYLALGTPLIITPGVEVDYPFPLEEGTHFLRAESPDDVQRIIAQTDPERWEMMSRACWQWFDDHGTIDRLFEHLLAGVKALQPVQQRHAAVCISAAAESVCKSMAARSLAIVDSQARCFPEEDAAMSPLRVDAEDLIVNELPLIGFENAYEWRIPMAGRQAYADSILSSDHPAHKRLLELLGMRFRNFRVRLSRGSRQPSLLGRICDGTLVLEEGEVAILNADYDWGRHCAMNYRATELVFRGPTVIEIPLFKASLTYRKHGRELHHDLSDCFNDYYASRQDLIPREEAVRICRLSRFADAELVSIEIQHAHPTRQSPAGPLRYEL